VVQTADLSEFQCILEPLKNSTCDNDNVVRVTCHYHAYRCQLHYQRAHLPFSETQDRFGPCN